MTRNVVVAKAASAQVTQTNRDNLVVSCVKNLGKSRNQCY